jgi:hypothetical protein
VVTPSSVVVPDNTVCEPSVVTAVGMAKMVGVDDTAALTLDAAPTLSTTALLDAWAETIVAAVASDTATLSVAVTVLDASVAMTEAVLRSPVVAPLEPSAEEDARATLVLLASPTDVVPRPVVVAPED